MPEKRRARKGRKRLEEGLVCGVWWWWWGGDEAREWKLDERRAGDGSGGGEAAREWRKSFKRDDDM